ncbi:MAG TPA: tryptophan--tRNA ligase [Actinomycetota bacterium]|nr:tryptophan--tRNA ligase [Actinomycetota bacterium]
MARKIALTGIQPSGTPHLGNYLGMYRPALELAADYDAYYFIADYHALTTVRDGESLTRNTYEVAAIWLALGLDPHKATLYRQSDVPEVFELAWALGCVTPKGLLNRAHAYKAALDANAAAGRSPDDGVSMGLYNYPLLMAADILICGAHVVPVGSDQRQHVEMTDDIASWFNNAYGPILTPPEAIVRDEVALIPGLDGRKMSKSYGNVIPIFAPPKEQRKLVMRIVTDSRPPEEPKDPAQDNLFNIFKHFAAPGEVAEVRARYESGGIGYGEVKSRLAELLEESFGPARERYDALLSNTPHLDEALAGGADRVRAVARPLLQRVRDAVGTGARL